jgi:hypothetical protein
MTTLPASRSSSCARTTTSLYGPRSNVVLSYISVRQACKYIPKRLPIRTASIGTVVWCIASLAVRRGGDKSPAACSYEQCTSTCQSRQSHIQRREHKLSSQNTAFSLTTRLSSSDLETCCPQRLSAEVWRNPCSQKTRGLACGNHGMHK